MERIQPHVRVYLSSMKLIRIDHDGGLQEDVHAHLSRNTSSQTMYNAEECHHRGKIIIERNRHQVVVIRWILLLGCATKAVAVSDS